MKLTKEIIRVIENQVPIPMATCRNIDEFHSIPNLIYVSSLQVYDDETILISDNKFNKTRENLKENPYIAITVYDEESNKSYQIKGRVTIHIDDEVYQKGLEMMEKRKALRKNKKTVIPNAIVLVHIEEIYRKSKKLEYIDGEPIFIKDK